MQLIRRHPQQLSLLSSKLIKQMPPYPTFYKEQHVIDSSLARKRLYFNFDWLGPPNASPLPPPKKKKRRENGGLCPSQRFGYDHVRFNNNIVREAEDLIRRSFLGTEGCPGSGVFLSTILFALDC